MLATNTNQANPMARGELVLKNTRLVWGRRTYIMGIVNATPDSFSGDGSIDTERSIQQAIEMFGDGADLLDVGGESTRPGHTPVDAETQCSRILPIVTALQKHHATISVDTRDVQVFRAAAAAGAEIFNSVADFDERMFSAAAELKAAVVITHNNFDRDFKGSVVDCVVSYFERQAKQAVSAGLKREMIILDPGIGFGKSPDENLTLMNSFAKITALNFPTLIGTSRKSTIGKVTGREVDSRAFGTAATVALAIAAGVDIVRVHDVVEMSDVVKMSDAIVRGWRPDGWLEK